MKGKSKKITIVASIILLISLLIVAVFIRKGKNVDNTTIQLTAEQQRAANYKVLGEDEGKITEANSNVEFRVYFTRPKNDGSDKADKVDGTCKQLNSKDTLYMELNVLNDGKLKDGTITINGSNFNYSMFMIKDDVLKENYLSNDVTEIKLKDINAGTQKLIFGSVIADIANNTKNYSNKSTITLKGKYEPSSGEEVEIEKEYEITVDWYGDIDAKLNTYNSTYYYDKMNFNKIDFNFQVSETKNQLLLKEVTATAEIPQLNGKDPESVVCTDPSVEYTYNKESRIVTMTKKSTVGDDGIITKSLSRQNSFRVSVTYPQEAIDEVTSYTQLFVHVTGQYIGFNNTNQEFIDREKSKVVEATLPIIFRETPPPVVGEVRHYRHSFAVQLTDKKWVNKPSGRYVISKQDLLNLCDNPEYKGNYKYTVRWSAYSGDLEDINSYEMSETKKDEDNGYGDKIDDHILENYTTNKGIYFSNATNALGEDGKISVYNADTDELIKEFTKEDWEKCTEKEPLKYDEDVKHIKIVTSKPSEDSYLYVYHLKELDANKIVEDFTKEDIEGFTTIFTYLTGVASIQEKEASSTDTLDSATLVSETSDAKISIDPVKLHTQETTNAKIYIDTIKNQFGDADWKNGEFVVKLPENVTKLDVKKITTNKENVVKVDFYDVYKEGKNYLIKIITSNEEKTTYRITIDCDITPDSRISSGTGELDLYAYNEHSNQYYTNTDDVYDVNSNNNKKEKVGKANCSVEFISPTSLITLETVSEYDSEQEGEITIAPNVAEVERETGEAKISINLTNNYPNTVTGVKILGKIPYENNKSIINERDLKSEFNTTMVKEGIVADKEEVRKKMEVYYSEKEAPTQDLDDENNGWKLSSDGVNFENVKSYLILLHDYRIESKEGIELYYKVKLPKNVSYNKASYSTHAVYFDYVTDGGKIDLYTEPAKVGVKIVNKYNLELTKYKVGSDVVIPGVTYSLGYTEKDTEGVDQQKTRILTTNEQGKIEVKDLHAGVLYTLKEIKVPDTCELSKEVNTFILNEEGTVEYSGNYKNKDFENNKTLRIGLEDEVKVNLQVTKTKIGTDDLYINNARFTIEDEDGNKKTSATKDGKVTFTGLSLDKTYTLTESSVPGGIALKEGKYKFKLSRKNGSIEVQQIENSLITEKTEITEDDNHITSTLKINVQDELRYTLDLTKQDEDGAPAQGVQFLLKGKGQKEEGSKYTSTKQGKITVSGLYVGEEYELKEISALGYYLDSKQDNKFTFKVERKGNGLEVTKKESSGEIEFGEPTIIENELKASISLTVKNEKIPTYDLKIVKKDDKGNKLAGAQFKLKSLDTNIEQSITTDENGIGIFKDLYEFVKDKDFVTGKYELTETYAPEGYRLNKNVVTFHAEKEQGTEKLKFIIDDENKDADKNENKGENKFDFIEVESEDEGDAESNPEINADEQTITINYTNKPIFSLKKQGENNEPLPGAKFKIVNITDEDNEEIAVTVDGKTLDGEYTDEEGNITANLPEGLYKAVEIEAPEGYELPDNEEERTYYFGVDASRPEKKSDEFLIQWQDSIGSSYITEFKSVVKTSDGGIIAVGSTDINTSAENLTGGYGNQDGIIVKYSSDGKIEWAKLVGGEGYDELYDIEANPNGEVYAVVGYVDSSSINYNGEELSVTDYGQADGFIMTIDEEGNKQWANTIGTEENDRINSVAINESGDVAVTGSYRDNGSKKGFVCTFEGNDGTYNWHKELSSTSDVWGKAITATSEGFAVGVNFGGNELSIEEDLETVANTKTDGTTDSVVIGFTSDGTSNWKKKIGSSQNDEIFDMTNYEDENGNSRIAVVGAFGDSISDVSLTRKSSSGTYDGMLVRLQEDGSVVSSVAIGGSSDTVVDSVETTNDGELLLGGWTYSSNVKCGNSSSNIVASNKGENDGFIIVINDSNTVVWNDAIQGNGFDSVDGVVQATDGSYYAVGDFDSSSVTTFKQSDILKNNSSTHADAYAIKYGQEILESAIPELQEITAKNKLKEFTITTEIGANLQGNRTGGTITGNYTEDYPEGQYKQFVEKVKYGKSNNNEIVIDPDEGHSITSITINGEEVILTPDDDGTVKIDKGYFKDMDEDKHIIVIFSEDKYILTIKKVDNNEKPLAGAEFEIRSKSDDEETYKVTTNEKGEAKVEVKSQGKYIVKETKAPEHYILSTDEQEIDLSDADTTGKTVTFENQKYALVTVHHYLKENGEKTETSVAEDVIMEGKPGDQYTASPVEGLNGLTLEKVNDEFVIPENSIGTYKSDENIVVTYYYEPTPIKLTIHHYLAGTQEEVILNGEPVKEEVKLTPSTVKVDDQGNYTVSATATYTLNGNQNYNNLISDYIFTSVTTQSTAEEGMVGEFNVPEITDKFTYTTDSEIIYYYELKSHVITSDVIPHTESRTNEKYNVKEDVEVEGGTITGDYTDEYPEEEGIKFIEEVPQKQDSTKQIKVIPDYGYKIKYVKIITTTDEGKETERLVYGKDDENINVDGEGETDDETGNETESENQVESEDETDVKEQQEDGKVNVALTPFESVVANKHIIAKFEPLEGTVIVHHILREKDKSESEYQKSTIHDLVNEPYKTGPIDIEHYKLVESRGEKSGKYTEEKIDVYYYYELKEYAYRVEYYYDNQIDDSATEHSSAKYDEKVNHYIDKPRKGYELVKKEVNDEEVDDVELKITDDPEQNVIKLYYEKADFNYTVKYYYDNVEDTTKTYTKSAKYEDKITKYENGDKEGYKLVEEYPTNDNGEFGLTITDDENQNVIKIYYQREYNITTEVMTHTETYSNGTVKTDVKGGSISGETDDIYEKVLKGNNNKQTIVIKPDTGYQIVNIWVTNKADLISSQNSGEGNQGGSGTEAPQDVTELINYDEYLENGIVTLPEEYFTNMQSDKHIKVEFRKTTKVTVKYLEKVGDKYTNTELADTVVIDGYEGQSYTTTRENVTYYKAATDSQNNITPANAEGEMKADEIIVIYYYERIPAGITVKYLEKVLDDDGNEKGIAISGYDEVHIEGFQGLDYHTQRQTIPNYVSTSPIELPDGSENVIYVEKSKDSQDGVYQEQPIEIVYWYERQFNISTKVITHEENRTNKQTGVKEKLDVEGGSITGQDQETLEKVIYNHSAQQRITVKPNEFYTIKYIAIVSIDRLGQEKRTIIYGKDADKDAEVICRENGDGSVTLSEFNRVKEDKRVEVEFEPIYGEVVVHHYIDGTGEQYHNKPVQVPSKEEGKVVENETIRDLIGEPYSTSPSDNVASIYELVDKSGDETGEITTDKIDVYYYYDLKGYEYRVEYYYDGELDEDETEKDEAKYGDKIIDYEKKERTGYKLEKVEPTNDDGEVELSITDKVEDNVIRVYYVKDKFKYTIEYYYDDVLDPSKTEDHDATYQDVISTYPDKSGNDYVEVDRKNVPLTISDDIEANVIKIYYKRQYKITTQVLTHKEEYSDGTVEENVKGGTISGTPETATTPTLQENVLKGDSNKKDIVIKPDDGYTVADVWITEGEGSEKKPFDYEDLIKDGVITIPEGYFEDMDSDKNIEVEFRKISNIIVKYLEKTGDVYTDNELLPQYEITGYETKPYTTSREVVLNYRSAVDPDGNIEPANAVGTMKADTVEVIYYYEKIPAGVTVKYVEKITDKDGNVHPVEIEGVDDKVISGFVGEKYTTSRETIENYVPAEPPKLEDTAKGVIYVDADKDEQSGVYTESPTEVYYWYERQFHIFTKVKPITEEGDKPGEGEEPGEGENPSEGENPNPDEKDPNKHPNGGTISQNEDPDTPYEDVLRSQENKKSVEMIPDDGYRVKDVVVNGESVDFSEFEKEDGSVVIPEGYFKDVQEDIVIEVEFERIPAKLTVKYVDEDTGEEIIPSEETDGFVNDEYSTERKELENYAPSGEDPENAKGKLVEDGVIVTYYYVKQFKITTDVVEHYEFENREVIEVPEDDESGNKAENEAGDKSEATAENEAGNKAEDESKDKAENETENNTENSDSGTDSSNSLGGKILVKGGKISGEDEQPYELVNRGKDNAKEIQIVPDEGYMIKYIKLKQPGVEIEKLDLEELFKQQGETNDKEDNNTNDEDKDNNQNNDADENLNRPITLKAGYFKDMQSDKHIEVEFERIPAKITVEYLDKDTQEKAAKSETVSGYVNDEYKAHEKEIPYYELVKDNYPENVEGKLGQGETKVTYWYRRLLFNMKMTKELASVQVNGKEVLDTDKKLIKVDIANTEIQNTNIIVKYKIKVSNTEEIAGTAKVLEQIPVGFMPSSQMKVIKAEDATSEQVDVWQEVGNNLELTTKELQPGETAEYDVILEWDTGKKIMGSLENIARITETQNIPNFEETAQDDNRDSCTVLIAVRTGGRTKAKVIISISCFILAGICTLVYIGTRVYYRRKNK